MIKTVMRSNPLKEYMGECSVVNKASYKTRQVTAIESDEGKGVHG